MADSHNETHLISERKARRADRFDEIWDEVYVVNPMPSDEHQELVMHLSAVLQEVMGWSGKAKVRPGVNVSDRDDDWRKNFRCPDVAVFLPTSKAINR